MPNIQLRAADAQDLDFMFSRAPLLAAVADLSWHEAPDLIAFQHRYMKVAFAQPKARGWPTV